MLVRKKYAYDDELAFFRTVEAAQWRAVHSYSRDEDDPDRKRVAKSIAARAIHVHQETSPTQFEEKLYIMVFNG